MSTRAGLAAAARRLLSTPPGIVIPEDIRHMAKGNGMLANRGGAWGVKLVLACVVAVLAPAGIYLAVNQLDRAAVPVAALDALSKFFPGQVIDISSSAPFRLLPYSQGALLSRLHTHAEGIAHIDLCQQRSLATDDPERLIPIRIGYGWADVQSLANENIRRGNSPHAGLRHIVLDAGEGFAKVPQLQIDGHASATFEPLRLRIDGAPQTITALSDATGGGQSVRIARGDKSFIDFRTEAWLLWDPIIEGGSLPHDDYRRGLRIQRQQSAACAVGDLVVTKWAEPVSVTPSVARLTFFKAIGGAIDAGSIAPGSYLLPASLSPPIEDKALFEAAVTSDLIRRTQSGIVSVAPRDLAKWFSVPSDSKLATSWDSSSLNHEKEKLLRRLYEDADGQFVLNQIAFFNKTRSLAALRIRTGAGISDDITNPANWQASSEVRITSDMPDHAARLFAQLPQGWGAWGRIHGVGNLDPQREVAVDIPLPAMKEMTIELLVIGHINGIEGGRLLRSPEAACRGLACRSPDEMQRLVVLSTSRKLHIRLRPNILPAEDAAREAALGSLRLIGDKIVWQTQTPHINHPAPKADVALYDRSGTLLYGQEVLQTSAREAGLGPLLGAYPSQAHSLADVLSRPGTDGTMQVTAKLTLDLPTQVAAQAILSCVGYRGGTWREGRCENPQPVPEGRRAGLILMDAATGDILAAAGQPLPPDNVAPFDLAAFDRANTAQSPLRVPGWQHGGGALRAPGSTFKLLTALALEQKAMSNPSIESFMQGLPASQITSQARAKGYPFDAQRACYPAPCDNHSHQVRNFRDEIPANGTRDSRLGLVEALTYSYNTWFAYVAEVTDKSLLNSGEGGVPDLLTLDQGAMDTVRPIIGMAHRLGFEQTMRLDGGLLSPDFPWQHWDALQAIPATFDPVESRHNLRQQAIGLRMQTTPLQMARVAAAIGEGKIVTPRLLLELNGRAASTPTTDILEMKLHRLRAGMKSVVEQGTARNAFSAQDLAFLAKHIYGKTGTAPTPSVGANLNTAWFVGWVEPGAWPGLNRRLAFASFVTHTPLTGGGQAAPVVAALMKQLALPEASSRVQNKAVVMAQNAQ